MDAVNEFRGTRCLITFEGAAQFVMTPIVLEFLKRYPAMRVDVVTDSRLVDSVFALTPQYRPRGRSTLIVTVRDSLLWIVSVQPHCSAFGKAGAVAVVRRVAKAVRRCAVELALTR